MECMHCGKSIHANPIITQLQQPAFLKQVLRIGVIGCPDCLGPHLRLAVYSVEGTRLIETHKVHPQKIGRKPRIFSAVDQRLLEDYHEACSVVELSSKAAATLARRCLQGILGDQGYKQKLLVKQVQALLDETTPQKALPEYLYETVDAIREFGNFGAHPAKEGDILLEIVAVEPGEAEFSIALIEELFDHFYEKPAHLRAMQKKAKERREATKDVGGKAAKTS